jgi:hypothetical protein
LARNQKTKTWAARAGTKAMQSVNWDDGGIGFNEAKQMQMQNEGLKKNAVRGQGTRIDQDESQTRKRKEEMRN